MAKHDITKYTLDELTELIDEATNLRTTKYEDRRKELVEELNALESRMGKKAPSTPSKTKGVSPAATHVGPKGETWASRGAVPKWAKEYGVTDRSGMDQFRKK